MARVDELQSTLVEACPDENLLARYAEHAVTSEERARIEVHLDHCDTCLAIVSDAPRSQATLPVAAPSGPALERGSTLGKYEIVRMLGEGGMGSVYEAIDPHLQRRVALKVVRTDHVEQPGMQARLLREARAMAKLSHPNVVTVYEAGEIDDRVYVAMELVEGTTLAEWLQVEARTWRDVVRVFAEAGRGIIAAHAAGMVHRDFKPANVLVDPQGRVAVTDFGLAVAPSSEQVDVAPTERDAPPPSARGARTATGIVMGTPAFMSPEQFAGERVDARTDVFSFSVALYRALYGQHPFEGDSLEAIKTAMREGRVRAPPAKTDVPRGVFRCLARGMSTRPDDRHPTMAAFVADLEREARAPRVGTRAAALGATLVTALAIGGALLARGPASARGEGASEARAVDASAARSVMPVPDTDVPAARAAYAEAVQGFRDGANPFQAFERAAQLDPQMAAAYLRAAMLRSDHYPVEARVAFQRADELRARLTPHDRELLEAFRPVIQSVPQDLALAASRVSALAARYPGDWEIAYYEAGLAGQRGEIAAAQRAAQRALASDPDFVAAMFLEATLEAYLGDFDAALRIAARCLEIAPNAAMCMAVRVGVFQQQGTCDDVEKETRAWTTAHPMIASPYRWLASAAYGQGAPEPAVAELLRHATELDLESRRRAAALRDASRLATLRGDFAGAEQAARAWNDAPQNGATAALHAEPSIELVQIYGESGDLARAGKVARDYLERLGAWTPDGRAEDAAIANDARPLMYAAERRAGLIDAREEEAHRARYFAEWRARASPFFAGYLWVHAYASLVEDPAQARAAVSALGAEPIPPYRPGIRGDGRVGWTLWLAGDPRGLPLLEREARACTALQDPFEATRAQWRLARAREAAGDKAGACAAYKTVLARWGGAKPASVTAKDAQKRAAALGCVK